MTTKERYSGIQSILANCGSEGCHFLSLCSIIEEVNNKPIDLIEVIKLSQSKGWLDSFFFVKDGIKLLNFFTKKKWKREEVVKLPKTIADNEYTEAVYFNERTGFYHYRRRGWDTIVDSTTVREGVLLKYYIWSFE